MRLASGLLILFVFSGHAWTAEREMPRFEIGPLFSLAQTVSSGPEVWRDYIKGYGGRLTANLHPNIAVELQGSAYPTIHSNGSSVRGSGHLKATLRFEKKARINVFAIAGPGFSKDETVCCGGHLANYDETRFALNIGGGIELVPSRKFAIRFDVTDFAIRETFTMVPASFVSNVDLKLAAMFRF